MRVYQDLEVCTVCIHILANGEYNDGTDAGDVAAAAMVRIWGNDAGRMVPGGDDLGFRTRPCDACGDTDHGDRFTAAIIR